MIFTDKHRIVFITTDSYDNATNIAKILVSEKLAACCSLINNTVSVYKWKGKIEKSNECQVIIKTTKDQLDNLESRIRELHPYEVPEILAVPITEGHEPYLKWINSIVG